MIFGVSDFATTESFDNAELITSHGLDFVEAGCAKVAALPDDVFAARAADLASKGINVQSMNWFLPPTLKVVGDEVDDAASRSFLEGAIARAEVLGAQAIVFGSPGSRTRPDGFSSDKARQQIVRFCHLFADVVEEQGASVRLAVEHVNHTETNMLNTFADAMSVATEVARPEVGLAADLYHFHMESESMEILRDAGDLVCAVQLANPDGRCFPKEGADVAGMAEFFQLLKEISYSGGVSVEATPGNDLAADCRSAVAAMRVVWGA